MARTQKPDELHVEAEVIEALPNTMFRVRLENGHEAIGYLAGRMRTNRIRVLPGDRVTISLSAYDLTRGRIVYRFPTS
jgi:translation initiation factor IF-1